MNKKKNNKKERIQEMLKLKNKNKELGITLVALVVTIVILLILAGVSINLILGQNGLIAKAQEAADMTKQAELNEAIAQNELIAMFQSEFNKTENILGEKTIKINVAVSSYNPELGKFPIIYNVKVVTPDMKIVYENVVSTTFDGLGTKVIEIPVSLAKGATVTVEEKYSGVNYDLSTGAKTSSVTVEDNEVIEFQFGHEYNYKLMGTSYVCNSFYYDGESNFTFEKNVEN